MIKEDRK